MSAPRDTIEGLKIAVGNFVREGLEIYKDLPDEAMRRDLHNIANDLMIARVEKMLLEDGSTGKGFEDVKDELIRYVHRLIDESY